MVGHPYFDTLPIWYRQVVQKCFPYNVDDLDFKEGLRIKTEYMRLHVPRLYKYVKFFENEDVSREEGLKNLISGKIYLKNPKEYNDPFDYHGHLNRERLRLKLSNVSEYHNAMLDAFVDDVFNWFGNKFKASCFTPTNDNLLMWSHYADSHSGYCIEYDLSVIDDETLSRFFPIIYVDNFIDFTPYCEQIIPWFINPSLDSTQVKLLLERTLNPWFTFLAGLIKSTCWEYENEWRLAVRGTKDRYPDFTLPVKNIFLGLNIKSEDSKLVEKITENLTIQVFKMIKNTDAYGVHPIKF